jgi:integrase
MYEPLPLPQSIGMALSCEEEDHLFAVARSRPRWLVAYCCGLISRNTTAGPGEIRHLRLGDIDIDTASGSFLHIEEGTKNSFRKRPVPLNADARWAVLQLVERAGGLGACEPQHCLLPHRARRRGALPDLQRPMGSWKTAHRNMCREAAKKFPRLAHLRFYDYRHTAATDLLEDPAVSYTTIEHIMGHRISSHTKRRYDHLRNSALRDAVEVLNRGHCAIAKVPANPFILEYAGPERRKVGPQREAQVWHPPWTARNTGG